MDFSPTPFSLPSNSVDTQQQPFELDSDGEILKPEMLLADWIEMVLLFLLLFLGLPLNVIALARLLNSNSPLQCRKISRTRQEVTKTSFHWLKLHLTLIDLIVIVCYCPSHIAWLINYTWNAGGFMCKAMQYSWDFCFHLMSFGVVGIALDRLRTVYGLMKMERTGKAAMCTTSKQLQFVQRLITICYVGAAIVSIPQWFVWTTIDLRKWSQCTTIWHKARALEYLQEKEFTESFDGEQLYTLIHLMTVFWIPFLVIFCAYLYIVVYLFYYSLRPYSNGLVAENPIQSSSYGHNGSGSEESNNEATSLWHKNPLPVRSSSMVLSSCEIAVKSRMVPAWRLEMRSRIFHTAIYVIAAYLICWMPYNVLALATFFSNELQIMISMHLELLRICVLLNTILNPFIYGFRDPPT